MTRQELQESHPKLYDLYCKYADREHLREEMLLSFESTDLPITASGVQIKQALDDACYEWDF